MAKIIVFNNDTNRMESYYRSESAPMPYNTNSTLKVREFRGPQKEQCKVGIVRDIFLVLQFPLVLHLKDHMKEDTGNQSQHYAGTAFDVGQTLTDARRQQLWRSANNSGVWAYVEPISLTPTWVHFDKRFGKPACASGGFPLLKRGSISNYVLIAQDDLNTLGYRTNGLDGIFGAATQNAVKSYQRSAGLVADGIVGCNTWRALQEAVIGTGPSNTTIN